MGNGNAMVELLRRASREPGYRPEFGRALIRATWWVPIADDGRGVTVAGYCLQVWDCDGVLGVPLFTAPERARAACEPGCRLACIKGRDLVVAAKERDIPLLVEPDEPAAVRIDRQAAAGLLEAEKLPPPDPHIGPGPLVMRAAPLPEVPGGLLRSMAIAMRSHAGVRRAWAALVQAWPPEQHPVELGFGIEGSGHLDDALSDGAHVLNDYFPEAPGVQIFDVTGGEAGSFPTIFRAHGTLVYESRRTRH